MNEDWLFPPDPDDNPRRPFDPATRAEALEAGCTEADLAALERLRGPARRECLKHVVRLRRFPCELGMVEEEARRFASELDAEGNNAPVSWLDLCRPLKLRKASMDHDVKRFYCWILKRRGGALAGRLVVDSKEFRALENTGWREEATHE